MKSEQTYRPYRKLLTASIQSRMEYRGSFFMYILTILGFYIAQISVIGVMLNRFNQIGSWGVGEIAFLYSLLVMALGVTSMIFAGMLEFSEFVRSGDFDRVLLRPLSPLLQILAMRFEPAGLAHFFLGLAALMVANRWLNIEWTTLQIVILLLVTMGGALILAAIRIIIAAMAFFTISNASLQHLAVFSTREFLLYPLEIYNHPVKLFLTFIFPIAFINFYPAHYFLDKELTTGLHPFLIFGTVPMGLLLMGAALFFWRYAVNSYNSTGN